MAGCYDYFFKKERACARNKNMAFIEVENLSYSYESDDNTTEEALKNLSFHVDKGEFVAILGHNGSGKSTLAKLLASVLELQSGSIRIDGKDLSAIESEDELFELRRRVGMVFQNPDDQLVATVVEEDIAFGPENLGIEPAEIRRRVKDALSAVGMLKYARHAPHRLSGGQKQRIAIAGVLAMMPDCIVFDEATAMLDPRGRADVMEMIDKIHRDGITVLHITHNMNEALAADRVIVINDGSVYLEGTPREVFSQVDRLKAVGLEAPPITELCHALAAEGVSLNGDILDIDEAAEQIFALFQAAGKGSKGETNHDKT